MLAGQKILGPFKATSTSDGITHRNLYWLIYFRLKISLYTEAQHLKEELRRSEQGLLIFNVYDFNKHAIALMSTGRVHSRKILISLIFYFVINIK